MRRFHLIILLALFVAGSRPALAAEPVPGDSCSTFPANSFQWAGGPENTGDTNGIFCVGNVWTNVINFKSGGNVGIGTTSPAAKLHVNGETIISSTGLACAVGTAGGLRYAGSAMQFCNGTSWSNISSPTPAGADEEIQFNDGGVMGANANLTWNNSSKRLGVGTTFPPNVTLDVWTASGEGVTTEMLRLTPGDGTNTTGTASRIAGYSDVINGYIDFKRFVASGPETGIVMGTYGGDVLTIRSSNTGVRGNVGIGTSTPSVSLAFGTTDAILIPKGTTAQRPGTPAAGMIRYCTSGGACAGGANGFEVYKAAWTDMGAAASSDIRLKTKIKKLDSSAVMDKLQMVQGYSFEYKDSLGAIHYGVMAQELEKIFPELVYSPPKDGMKSVRYMEFAALLVEATKGLKAQNDNLYKVVQEQKQILEDQQAKIDKLEKEFSVLLSAKPADLKQPQ